MKATVEQVIRIIREAHAQHRRETHAAGDLVDMMEKGGE